jgi:hypothetical protein
MKSGRIEFPRVYEDVLDRLALHWHFVLSFSFLMRGQGPGAVHWNK